MYLHQCTIFIVPQLIFQVAYQCQVCSREPCKVKETGPLSDFLLSKKNRLLNFVKILWTARRYKLQGSSTATLERLKPSILGNLGKQLLVYWFEGGASLVQDRKISALKHLHLEFYAYICNGLGNQAVSLGSHSNAVIQSEGSAVCEDYHNVGADNGRRGFFFKVVVARWCSCCTGAFCWIL